jgi:hypothetical protein
MGPRVKPEDDRRHVNAGRRARFPPIEFERLLERDLKRFEQRLARALLAVVLGLDPRTQFMVEDVMAYCVYTL